MTTSNTDSLHLVQAFEQEARRLMAKYPVPGVSLALLLPDGDHYVNLGVTSLEDPLPVTAQTLFQIGSTTKTITSLTLSVLSAQGKLNLDDPVRTHLPDFVLQDEAVAARLTLRDLLTHQGGFQGDLFEDTGPGDDATERVLKFLAEAPQVVPMRSHWSYNNAGFYVLGRVIEVVSGQTYEAAVTELVLRPLGMDCTFFTANEVMTHRFSTGYVKVGDDFVVQRPWMMMRSAAPAGSTCCSSAEDMTKYARYLMHGTVSGPWAEPAADEPQPEAAATSPLATFDRTTLWAPVRGIGDSLNGFPGDEGMIGQAWFLDQYPDALIISHGGTTMGHQSDFWVSPDRQVGFIAMTNASSGHLLNRKLSEWVKREVLGLSAPTRDPLSLNVAELTGLSGTYLIPGQPLQITSQVENGQLTFSVPDSASGEPTTAPLQVIAPDRALITGGEMEGFGVEFLRDREGEIDFIRFSGRLFPREGQPGK